MRRCDVSLIVTAYDQREFLIIVLNSLAKQDFSGSWELIICDDGSEQETLDLLRRFSIQTDVPTRYIWQSRLGSRRAQSRNNALRCAVGDIVVLLDGDIAVGANFISAHAAEHQSGRTSLYGARYWLFLGDLASDENAEGKVQSILAQKAEHPALYSETWYQERFADSPEPWLGCMACNFSFRRIENELILFDERFVGWGAEDQEFACRLKLEHGFELKYRPSIFGLHLDRQQRKSFKPVRPRLHTEIVSYISNVALFCYLHPQVDLVNACVGISYYTHDPAQDCWKTVDKPVFDRSSVAALMLYAAQWLEANQLLPYRQTKT